MNASSLHTYLCIFFSCIPEFYHMYLSFFMLVHSALGPISKNALSHWPFLGNFKDSYFMKL